jgi:ferredoxin
MLKGSSARYVFAICTYGGFGPFNAWPTLQNLSALLRDSGVFLSGAFSIKLPLNNLDYDHIPVPINRNHQVMFDYTDAKLQAMAKRIRKGKKSKYRIPKRLFCFVTKPLFSLMGKYVYASLLKTAHESADSGLGFRDLVAISDRSISVDDACNGCGLCEKICPVKNITLLDGKPVWNRHCEMCLACDEWCPQRAVRHWCKTRGKDYRHPEVSVANMLEQREC